MNIFRKLHKKYMLNKYAKVCGIKRIKPIFKEPLITKVSIEDYFKECWYVRNVVIGDKKQYMAVDINIKSWFPLSKKMLSKFKEEKPFGLYTKIHNKWLLGIKEFKF